MPLSKIAKKALDDSARINNERRRRKNQQREKDDADRLQAEIEYNRQTQELAILKENERLVIEEQKQAELIIQEKQNERQAELNRYHSELSELEAAKRKQLSEMHTRYWSDANLDGIPDGGERSQGKGRSQYNLETSRVIKTFNERSEVIENNLKTAQQRFALQDSPLPAWVKAKAAREWDPVNFTTRSALDLAQSYYDSFEADSERKRLSSIKTAQSNAIIARDENEKIIREFELKKETSALKLIEAQNKLKQSRTDIETAKKKRPEIKDSSFFRGHESSVIPPSILGTTKEKSDQAQLTLKEIEAQQKKLYEGTLRASSAKEAIRLRQDEMESNPYVGTANVLLKKGGVVSQSGVLVDLKLDKKYEKPSIASEDLIPQKIQSFESSVDTDRLVEIPEVEKPKQKIPEYEFLDDKGNPITLNAGQLFSYASSLIDKKISSSNVDDKINEYIQENQHAILDTERLGQSGLVANPLDDQPLLKGFLDTGTEFAGSIENLFRPENDKRTLPETLEGVFFSDLIGQGSEILGADYNESKTSDYIKDKIKTREGTEELVGSAFGAVVLNYAIANIPGLLQTKVIGKAVKKVETKQLVKVAEDVTKKLKDTPESIAQAKKLKQQFPEMPDNMIKQIVKPKEKIVGYEILDSRTALIKRGTESGEELTPYIVVRTGKNPRSTVYQTYDIDTPGTYRKILVSGNQSKELSKGVKVTDDITQYPSTRDNVLKVDTEKRLAKVGSSEDVGQKGFVENPSAVIEKLESQKAKTGSLIVETERISKGASKAGTDASKTAGDTFKGKLGSKEFDYHLGSASTKVSKKEITPMSKTFADDIAKTAKTENTSKGAKAILETKPKGTTPTQTKRLEKFIKSEVKGQEIIAERTTKLRTYSASAGMISAKAGLTPRQDTRIDTSVKQTPAQAQKLQNEIKLDVQSKQSVISDRLNKMRSELIEKQKQRPDLDPRYSLIVSGGQASQSKSIPVYRLETPQKTAVVPIVPRKNVVKRPPVRPGFNISLDLEKKEINTKQKQGKPKISYYRYNVNTESVGRYIDQAPDIAVGKTRKVIDRVDRLERKINSRPFKRKQERKESRNFKNSLKVFVKRSGSLTAKADIPNITPPKRTKKNKKFLKRFDIKFGF